MIEDSRDVCLELLEISTKVENLYVQAYAESESLRLAKRLVRDPQDLWAISKVIINAAKKDGILGSLFAEIPMGRFLLHSAIQVQSMCIWEDVESSPSRPIRIGTRREDATLMPLWREEVRGIIEECGERSILSINPEDYIAEMISMGASQEVAEALADWVSIIKEGTTPSSGVDVGRSGA